MNVIFDNPSNTLISKRIESALYNPALQIPRTIGFSIEKLRQKVGFESKKERGDGVKDFVFSTKL